MSKELMPKEKAGELVVGTQKYLPSTLDKFLRIYNPRKVQEDLRQVKTVKQAIMVQTPSIATLRKTYGERQIGAYIKLWIIQLNEFLNVARPLKEVQIDECARLILSEYWGMSIADINIVFRKAKMGGYGELYESLSLNKILGWFKEYYNDRLNTAGQMAREGHDNYKYKAEKVERVTTEARAKMDKAGHEYRLGQLKNKLENRGKDE